MIYNPNDWRRTHQLRACLAGPNKREIEEMVQVGANVVQVNLNAPVTDLVEMEGILGGDPVGDFVEFTHGLGAKAVGYLNTRLGLTLKKHPDWVGVNEKGERKGGDEQPHGCQVSPYGQHVIDRMAIYTKKYPIDGWWLDCWTFDLQNCWCEYCKKAFTEATGAEMPEKADPADMRWRRYAEWRDKEARKFFARMDKAIKEINPDCHIWVNFSPGPHDAPLPHFDTVFRMVEGPTVEQWLTGHMDNSLTAPFSIARIRGEAGYDREAEIWIVCNPLQWDRTTTPDVEFMARTYTTITYGMIAQYPTGPGHNEQMKVAFDAIRAREKWLVDIEPVKYAALVLSFRTPEYYGQGDAIKKYYHEIMGIFRALIEEHVPVNIVTEEDVTNGALKDYPVVILPNMACMTDEQSAALHEYVAGGGSLVVTHDTGRYKRLGELRPTPALQDLLKGEIVGEETTKLWEPDRLWLEDHETTNDKIIQYSKWSMTTSTPEGWQGSVDYVGRSLNVKAAEGTVIVGKRHGAGNKIATWPALILSQSAGKGRAAWFPMDVGTAYYNTSYPYLRRWMRHTIEWAARNSYSAKIEAPMCVLTTFWTQNDGRTQIIHLLNDNSSSGRRGREAAYGALREEVLPIYDIRVKFDKGAVMKKVTLQPEGIDLSIQKTAEGYEVRVPKLVQHSMIIVE